MNMSAPSTLDVRFRSGERAPCWRVPVRAYPPKVDRTAYNHRMTFYPIVAATTGAEAIERVQAIYGIGAFVMDPEQLQHAHSVGS